MNVRELMVWASTQPDDMQVLFHVDGIGYKLGHVLAVLEWNVAYFGVDKEELAESLSEEMSLEADDLKDGQPEAADTILKERDAFLEALESHENAKDLEGDPCCDTSCDIRDKTKLFDGKPAAQVDPAVGVM